MLLGRRAYCCVYTLYLLRYPPLGADVVGSMMKSDSAVFSGARSKNFGDLRYFIRGAPWGSGHSRSRPKRGESPYLFLLKCMGGFVGSSPNTSQSADFSGTRHRAADTPYGSRSLSFPFRKPSLLFVVSTRLYLRRECFFKSMAPFLLVAD